MSDTRPCLESFWNFQCLANPKNHLSFGWTRWSSGVLVLPSSFNIFRVYLVSLSIVGPHVPHLGRGRLVRVRARSPMQAQTSWRARAAGALCAAQGRGPQFWGRQSWKMAISWSSVAPRFPLSFYSSKSWHKSWNKENRGKSRDVNRDVNLDSIESWKVLKRGIKPRVTVLWNPTLDS